MTKNLVIVESPAKAKTIKKYLGKDFEVLASYGHVRDLIPKEGAVDVAHGFTMKYDIIREKNKEKHVDAILKAAKKAQVLYLATDPDREGEAISWHINEILQGAGLLDGKREVHRAVFYEITKKEVQQAIAHPRQISGDLVNAQQARRALDYLVGFNLSPLLWKKVMPGLSAGRVQSVALRLLCDREAEINAFTKREYWTIEVDAQVGVRRDFLEVGIESMNLLGARYAETEYAFVSNWRSAQVPSYLPARHITAGPPRQVMLTMTVHL